MHEKSDSKKIMILGAGLYQIPLIEKAKELGLYTIVVSPGDYPGMALADKVIDLDIKDREGVYRAAKEEQVDGIVTDEMDLPLLSMAYACEKLGLPGNPSDVVKLYTGKGLMREKLHELGIDKLEYLITGDKAEAVSFFEGLGHDAIIKPLDSGASKGVSKISSVSDIEMYFEEASSYSSDGKVLIERFVEGREVEVDSIALGGDTKVMMTGDLLPFSIPNVFSCTRIIFPSDLDEETMERLYSMDREVNSALGIRQGLTHNEYVIDAGGNIYIMEAAARGGGRHISNDIAFTQTGLDIPEFLIKASLGETESIPAFETKKCVSGYMAFYLPEGTVKHVSGIEEASALPFVDRMIVDIKEGMTVKNTVDKMSRHLILFHADSREDFDKKTEALKELLDIQVETSEGLKPPVYS